MSIAYKGQVPILIAQAMIEKLVNDSKDLTKVLAKSIVVFGFVMMSRLYVIKRQEK